MNDISSSFEESQTHESSEQLHFIYSWLFYIVCDGVVVH